MLDRKQQLQEVFADTQKFYTENEVLKQAVAYSRTNTKLYKEDDYPDPFRYSIHTRNFVKIIINQVNCVDNRGS